MKTPLCWVLVFGILLITLGCGARNLTVKEHVLKDKVAEASGFRGLAWGAEFSTVKDTMRFKADDPRYGGMKIYTRIGDELKIGGAELVSIEYSFWQDKLEGVKIYFKGHTNYEAVRDTTIEKFGPGDRVNRYLEDYNWYGEVTGVMLRYSDITKEGGLYLFSVETLNQQINYDKEKAKKGAATGF